MNSLSPSVDEFIRQSRAFLAARCALRPADPPFGQGPDDVLVFAHHRLDDTASEIKRARDWRAELFDSGFGWIDGPIEYGGRGLSREHAAAFRAVSIEFAVPNEDSFMGALRIVAPTLLSHGSDDLKERYLRRIQRGELLACQLFSEPEAGSDLASLKTRAERHGDGWCVNGQKVWTSDAQFADIGLLLARTDPFVPKHKGITIFVVDMTDPAIDIRPLRQMNGEAHFNEVFIDNLLIGDDRRVGPVDGGWPAVMTTLMSERAAVGARLGSPERRLAERVIRTARRVDAERLGVDSGWREALTRAFIMGELQQWTNDRFAGDPEKMASMSSLSKLLKNRTLAATMYAAQSVLGASMTADTGEWGTYAWAGAVLDVPGQRIAGGTDEIQKNTLAEHVLGLPR